MPFSFSSSNIIILLLAFAGGFIFALILSGWLSRMLITFGLVILAVVILIQGPMDWMRNLTDNLSNYFFLWPFGPIGAILGVFAGASIKKRT